MTMDVRSAFGCHSTPCTREIEPSELFVLPYLEQAREYLVRTLEQRQSAALIAPPGTGKTALVRRVIADLPEARYRAHYVKVTDLGKRDLCREIARVVGVPAAGSYPSLFQKLQDRFETSTTDDGIRPVLFLDEAHDLRPNVLGMIRVLTNFQMDSRLVLSVVLVGQSPLRKMLEADQHVATAHRMACTLTLRLLTREETQSYVEHRMRVAGMSTSPFDQSALDAIFELSRGNLRAIDGLALGGLELAAGANLRAVGSNQILAARKLRWV
jgi:general secretion pathway protein A